MEGTQQAIVIALLNRLQSLDLLSKATYLKAVDLVDSMIDFPDFFQYAVCSEEVSEHEYSENTCRDEERENDI